MGSQKEIEVLLNEIFIPILEMRNSTLKQKGVLLAMILKLCQDPQALVEIYLNYDCDRDALENIYERYGILFPSKLPAATSTLLPQTDERRGKDRNYKSQLLSKTRRSIEHCQIVNFKVLSYALTHDKCALRIATSRFDEHFTSCRGSAEASESRVLSVGAELAGGLGDGSRSHNRGHDRRGALRYPVTADA